ncbi:hypothetical protein M3795_24920 [Ralstonia pickettii]|uniref:hypothetical protein n=1 Tax=Ralstonia pickettii TaxID=329 RepID=UPI0020409074|nr:hypothetical protein [Ralstonia pickettii]MCM3583715.1 hypothetical protein [Ralstonia pickettii]
MLALAACGNNTAENQQAPARQSASAQDASGPEFAAYVSTLQLAQDRQDQELVDVARKHLINAVAAGDVDGGRRLLDDGDPVSHLVWEATAPGVVALADKLIGQKTPQARVYLRLAGNLVSEGQYVPRNYDRATLYYAGSWAAGEGASAALMASTYYAAHDLVNTYLWTLRCTEGCGRLPASMKELEDSLDAPTMKLIQSKVSDPTVMGL